MIATYRERVESPVNRCCKFLPRQKKILTVLPDPQKPVFAIQVIVSPSYPFTTVLLC